MDTLTDLLGSRVKAEILRLLFGVDEAELHVREIGRRSRLNDATGRQELKRLTRVGVVDVRRDGNRTYDRADVAHPLYVDIHNLVLKTSGLVELLRKALGHPGVRLAFVFGSTAAGTTGALSDVDLMVVGKISLRQVAKLLSGIEARVGREVIPFILTPEELRRRKQGRDHFLTTVLAGPRLWVIGNEDELAGMGG